MLKSWNVHVHSEGRPHYVGQVGERNEPLARSAALSRFCVNEDEIAAGEALPRSAAIYPDVDFDVSPAA